MIRLNFRMEKSSLSSAQCRQVGLQQAEEDAQKREETVGGRRLQPRLTATMRGCRTRRVVASFFAKFRQNVARFWLYRHRFLQENTRFAAFLKIYQIF